MANRATLAELRGAVTGYAVTLAAYRILAPYEAASITVASPYGPVRYVVRDVAGDGGRWVHDVPGFEGSGGSGFLSIREGIDRLRQSCRVLNEAGYRAGWEWDSDAAEMARAIREGL